jgi:hypothetical protein
VALHDWEPYTAARTPYCSARGAMLSAIRNGATLLGRTHEAANRLDAYSPPNCGPPCVSAPPWTTCELTIKKD